jgi:LysR family nitrogen assimilation transcriptional regulator
MNPRHLKHFLRVAEVGSLSKASVLLYVAQPALSRQMTQLEHDLGVTLFVRSDRGVALTEAGQQLRDRGATLLHEIEDLKRGLSNTAELPSGRLDILVTPSLAALVAAPTAAAFVAQNPRVQLNMVDGSSSVANPWNWIVDGRVQFAVGTSLEPMADMYSAPFAAEPL